LHKTNDNILKCARQNKIKLKKKKKKQILYDKTKEKQKQKQKRKMEKWKSEKVKKYLKNTSCFLVCIFF
jgi:DNA-binding helix-hairpin-helix protein with protein kinase domain